MLDIVYEFFLITGLDTYPTNLADLIPYLFKFVVAVVLVLAVFRIIAAIVQIFCDGRWLR